MKACLNQHHTKKVQVARVKETVSIKFYEVLNWLFSSETELPKKFLMNESKLNSIVPYLAEQFWAMPQLTDYLNEHTNDLYQIPESLEMLRLLKKIIKTRGLTKANCWSFIPNRKPNLLKEVQERDKLDTGDARAKVMLMQKLGINTTGYFKAAPTKKNTNLKDAVVKVRVKEAIEIDKNKKIQKKEAAMAADSRYLKELNQTVIDDLELILFDVSLLKKTNRVLFTFIDAMNQKKYFMTPFLADIYLSKKDGVINNDYIEDLNDDFIHYVINDIKMYTKLKFTLNSSYKRILNGH